MNEVLLACQMTTREHLEAIHLAMHKNSPQSERAGLVLAAHAINSLACRYIEPPNWLSHTAPDDELLNKELGKYHDYISATVQTCKAVQRAVLEKRLILRSELTRLSIDTAYLDSWLNMDIDAAINRSKEGFLPDILELTPFQSWPYCIYFPKGAFDPVEFANWATDQGLGSTDSLVKLTSNESPAGETPKERRARWLKLYGNGERGAIQRVYESERKMNPRADRSFIGKEIKKAKSERDGEKVLGNMSSQLVRNGKRAA